MPFGFGPTTGCTTSYADGPTGAIIRRAIGGACTGTGSAKTARLSSARPGRCPNTLTCLSLGMSKPQAPAAPTMGIGPTGVCDCGSMRASRHKSRNSYGFNAAHVDGVDCTSPPMIGWKCIINGHVQFCSGRRRGNLSPDRNRLRLEGHHLRLAHRQRPSHWQVLGGYLQIFKALKFY